MTCLPAHQLASLNHQREPPSAATSGAAVTARLECIGRLRAALHLNTDPERETLLRRIEEGEVTLLDVRPTEEWEANHRPGALHIALDEVSGRLGQIEHAVDVVSSCRGPYCPMALMAFDRLRDAGFRADHLDLGPPDIAVQFNEQVNTANNTDTAHAVRFAATPGRRRLRSTP